MISSVIFYPNWAYPYIQKGAFLYSKWAFLKAVKGVVPKIFPGAKPPDPHYSLPPSLWRLAPPLGGGLKVVLGVAGTIYSNGHDPLELNT